MTNDKGYFMIYLPYLRRKMEP